MKCYKPSLLILFVLVAFVSNAQFKFGVGGGASFSNFSNGKTSNDKGFLGPDIGVVFELKFPEGFAIQIDVFRSIKGTSYELKNGSVSFSSEYKLKYIDVPITFKLYLRKEVSLQGGIQYSLLTDAVLTVNDIRSNVKNQFKPGDLALVLGFGIDESRLHYSARYSYGLLSIFPQGDSKIHTFTMILGFWIK